MSERIHKVGAVIVRDRALLVGKKGKKFILPGGRIEGKETHQECLRRELMEEFNLTVKTSRFLGRFEDAAALDPGMIVVMDVYYVDAIGEPKPANEISQAEFVTSKSTLPLGSIITKFVMPALVAEKLVD